MSLINDALKRAKQAKQEQRPPDSEAPPLRPVELVNRPGLWPFLVLPLALAVVLALAGIFLWRWMDQNKYQPPSPVAKAGVAPNLPSANQAAPLAPKPAAVPPKESQVPAVVAPAGAALTPPALTNAVASVVAVGPPPPPPLKLQGIFYTRRNPSAVINGKTRQVGDRIGESRILAITPNSVIVEEGGKTNELVLP